MSFVYASLLPVAIIAIVAFVYFNIRFEKQYFSWIKQYWFYKRTIFSKLRLLCLLIGVSLLILSLLDLRGPETTVTGDIPDQKTIILIDTSSSMLAEDVRPNRLEKAIVLARHFVKKVVGHQISIAVFSDMTVQISPFTDDPNFLDAKIQSLQGLNLRRGGTSLVQALNEAIQILKVHSGLKNVAGNILIFSDSEDHGDMGLLDVPDSVNVAFVGIGTREGAKIPVKGRNGDFLHYKKYEGKEVVTKLDEEKIKELGKKIKNFKYWVALSYSLPTNEIEQFFKSKFQASLQKGQMKIRPVLAHYFLIPSIIFLIASFAFDFLPAAVFLALFSLISPPENSWAQDVPNVKEPKLPELSNLYKKLDEKLKTGNASNEERLKMAEELLKAKRPGEAVKLYNENYREDSSDDVTFNFATALLQNKQYSEAVVLFNQLKNKISHEKLHRKMIKNINHNLALVFDEEAKQQQQQQEQKEQKDQEKKDQEKKDQEQKDQQNKDQQNKDQQNKDQQNKDQQNKDQQNKDQQNKDQQNKDQQNKDQQNKDQQNKDQQNKDQQNKDQKNKDQQDQDSQQDEEQKDKDKKEDGKKDEDKSDPEKEPKKKQSSGNPIKMLEQKEKDLRQKRKMKRIPGIVNQIMDEDQAIMREIIDASAANPGANAKDW